MQTKKCPMCKLDLPKSSFTSTRAKYCNTCKRIHQLEQRNEMMKRSMDRQRNKKPKTVTVESISALKKRAQKVVNRFCRERDKNAGLPCISCQVKPIDEGGHFWAMGSNSALRFDERNINGQCTQCNKWGHGNLLNYRLHLVEKIGKEDVEWLDQHHTDYKKWTREELLNLIERYK